MSATRVGALIIEQLGEVRGRERRIRRQCVGDEPCAITRDMEVVERTRAHLSKTRGATHVEHVPPTNSHGMCLQQGRDVHCHQSRGQEPGRTGAHPSADSRLTCRIAWRVSLAMRRVACVELRCVDLSVSSRVHVSKCGCIERVPLIRMSHCT